ncbi:adenosylcobinamide-phosphate synthase CbiB [Metabacillus sp. 113a]|uniref:adenosylcobinamide-phosphate synthase CbiB n=1 Tax=Metabacillus sp. 113a TaxID=3404706 RepID=UPI003CF26AF7
MLSHLAALTVAVLLDKLIGDPPAMPHPVRWFGRMILFLESRLNKGNRKKGKGIFIVLILTGIVLFTVVLLQFLFWRIHAAAGILFEAAVIFTAIAQKSLKEAALKVEAPLADGNISEARTKLSCIVGRDTDHLEKSEIVRGTVETVAENTSDGVTAPLFWAAIGGAPFAAVYRLINTLDSMVGYKNEKYHQFGWASARLDDVLNWIPARITAFTMLAVHWNIRLWPKVASDAAKHPSPNSGWGEAAVAYLLGVELGGTNHYKGVVSSRARMGRPDHPLHVLHIGKSIEIMDRSVYLFIVFLWIGGMLFELASTWL